MRKTIFFPQELWGGSWNITADQQGGTNVLQIRYAACKATAYSTVQQARML